MKAVTAAAASARAVAAFAVAYEVAAADVADVAAAAVYESLERLAKDRPCWEESRRVRAEKQKAQCGLWRRRMSECAVRIAPRRRCV
ncbi:uncharacterized protein V2V93DRAFT_373568 [Kockiozyma suomiensis]|uniref:uncharacterized protein n=1 Tax=Kockiozyma suomiensis TaxID=1337062 RepID=UPI003343ED5D